MNNYEFIIAGLPVLSQDFREAESLDVDAVVEEILEGLDDKDKEAVGKLLDGFDPEKLGEDFYRDALLSRNSFLRDYFSYDLCVRNIRTRSLNAALGRDEGKDIVTLEECEPEFDDAAALEAILKGEDILAKEHALDSLMWSRIDELTILEPPFSLNFILGFIAKLKIVGRWLKLDPETGKALFKQFVDEIKDKATI